MGFGSTNVGKGSGDVSSMPSNFSQTRIQSGPNSMRPVGPTSQNWNGKNWAGGPWHHHHRHHNRVFVGVGFAGGYDYGYDYGYYDSCWRLVPTAYGWQRVWVCDYGYPYGGY